MKYSDQLALWLKELGYSHCFFVAGGNIMHLLESCSRVFTCIPVIHEVAAGIAAEYFNEVSTTSRAFALVTAGPGLTNIVTAMAGAYLESRELLVLGGQGQGLRPRSRRRPPARHPGDRRRQHRPAPVTVTSRLIDAQLTRTEFTALAKSGSHGRKGPVFLELPLDIQGAKAIPDEPAASPHNEPINDPFGPIAEPIFARIESLLKTSQRPVLLIGGGVSRDIIAELLDQITAAGIPLMLTWNGLDRLPDDHPLFLGRPNTWGQRAANILIQQADLLIALGDTFRLAADRFQLERIPPRGNGRAGGLRPGRAGKRPSQGPTLQSAEMQTSSCAASSRSANCPTIRTG